MNRKGNIHGVLTIRWRGDPYMPRADKVAGIETLIVDPEARGSGVGTSLMAAAIEHAFEEGYEKDGKKEGAKAIRAWVMKDQMAGDYIPNERFLRYLGFQTGAGNWPEYARKRNIPTFRGDAVWFELRPEWYDQKKAETPILPLKVNKNS